MKQLIGVPQTEAQMCAVPDDNAPQQDLHVFMLVDGVVPQVATYKDDDDGREQVAALVRGGSVLGVVRGFAVRYTVESVVTLSTDAEPFTQALTMKSSEVPLG